MATTRDRLERYREKRAAGKTPEPFGGGASVPATGRLFVIHKHHARNLHWDLRLEHDGALESWAVPKGPSPNPADKRLAMHVEPHPLDYAEFEGVIPEGEYGAGPSIVWDKGIWIPKEDVTEGFEKGKLLFELWGFKVKGLWTLVHTPKAGENHWLLIKEKDGYVDPGGTGVYPDDSIYSGLAVDELPEAEERATQVVAYASELGAKERKVRARDVEVMKATARREAFSDPDWVFELKYDGYRLLAGLDGGAASLISRNGNDLTDTFPEVARAVRGLPYDGLVFDGEVVVHDEKGLPSFGRLQKRGTLQRRGDIARAALELPATYYAFDLLAVDDLDLRGLPLVDRKELLQGLLPAVGPIRYSEHIAEVGEAMYEHVTEMRLEGIVAKKADGPYRAGPTKDWYKIAALETEDFVVVGWTEPKGGRTGFAALHLGWYVDGQLMYAGSVGSGFSSDQLTSIQGRLEPLEIDAGELDLATAAGEGVVGLPKGKAHHWVEPAFVVEVRYREITGGGQLRHPVFLRLRADKNAEECRPTREAGLGSGDELPEPPPVVGDERVVPFTNLDKVFWPEEGYTKGDLIEYYRAVSRWMLPYLEDRPLVLTRFPDGIDGKSFYQKDAPDWAPDWLRTVTVWSDSSGRPLNYFVADSTESLLYLANLGTIPLHIWHSRVADLEHPDWCLLDLDPKDAPFAHVVEVALFLHELMEAVGLPHYVKTSGSTGLHLMVPLGGQMSYDQCRALGQLLAQVTARELPKIATVERVVSRRAGKVYIDFLQNRQGQLMASFLSVRPKPGATVSAPLSWKEVGEGLAMSDFTIETVPPRMERLEAEGGDPCRAVLTEEPDLMEALGRLGERVGGRRPQ